MGAFTRSAVRAVCAAGLTLDVHPGEVGDGALDDGGSGGGRETLERSSFARGGGGGCRFFDAVVGRQPRDHPLRDVVRLRDAPLDDGVLRP